MNTHFSLETSVTIASSVSKVWDALVNPDIIREYFFGTEAESTWKVGSPIVFAGTWEGKAYQDKGIVLKNNFERELQYSYWSSMSGTEDKPENYATITYTVNADKAGVVLTVKQEGFKTEEQKNHSEQNWKMVLENIKSMLVPA